METWSGTETTGDIMPANETITATSRAASSASDSPPETEPKAISRALLPQIIADRLRDMIIQNELPPGGRIRERVVSEKLNVSRTPLREALKALATEGLVELLPNRGAVVANPSLDEVRDMLEVQRELEGMAGRLFCGSATDRDIAEIRALHYEMLGAYARGDRLGYFKLNQGIHRKLVDVCGNGTLSGIYANLSARLYRFRFQPNLWPDHWKTAVEEHEEILKAVVARDGQRLVHILQAHIDTTMHKLTEVVLAE